MHVRVLYKVGGGHTHIRVFVGACFDFTHAHAGNLCFRNEEWAIIAPQWERLGWQVVNDLDYARPMSPSGGG